MYLTVFIILCMVFIINLFTRNTCRPNLFLKSRYFCIHCFFEATPFGQRNKSIQLLRAIRTEKIMKIHYIQTIGSSSAIQHPTEYLRFSFPQFWCRIWREGNHRNYSGSQCYSVAQKIFCFSGQLQFWLFWMPQDRCLLIFQVFSETWQCFTSSSTQKWTLKSYCYKIPYTTGAESHK